MGDWQYHWIIRLSDGRQVFFTAKRIELPGGRLIVPGTELEWAPGEWISFYASPVIDGD